ncbi:MAG: single-stranded-DNA-specific exonuclease RecJ [Bacteroidetes bacterium]|nr:single-stranded-DNA-specific exonuclease RecJ [Bacteroidota bacterium]
MEKRWVIKERGDEEKIKKLAQVLSITDDIANLLVQRGIYTYEQSKYFFRPQLAHLHDPFLMKDMDRAIERIEKALANDENILIYGDYDVDGTTAVALVYTYFKSFYNRIDFYIPDRYSEGYGISFQGIDYADKNGFSLIIALDCGIKEIEKVAYATSKNIDFVICDHHRPGDELPAACAILDPKRSDCNYPFNELSGCGVGFKLVQAFEKKNNVTPLDIFDLLDLVAVSIAADIVPVTGENRTLAYYGLKQINSFPRHGIEAILKYSNVKKQSEVDSDQFFNRELTISDLVFLVGPRINAAGRIKNARNSVELLISDNGAYATELAEKINSLNTERRNLDSSATQHALELIASNKNNPNLKSTVVYYPEWHKGIIGIVASRLTEYYYRPTIVFTKSKGLITGSARSIKDFDVYDAIDHCSDLLEHFGGHKYAAGLSLQPENLELFTVRFEKYVSDNISEEMQVPEIEIDALLSLNKIDTKFYRILKQFAPFGPGNMSPTFKADEVVDAGFSKIVGVNHLKLNVIHQLISGLPFPAIAFQQAEYFDHIRSGLPFDICYHIEENEWNGNVKLQLNIKDIKVRE